MPTQLGERASGRGAERVDGLRSCWGKGLLECSGEDRARVLEAIDVWGQPRAWTDELIASWSIDFIAEQHGQSLVFADCLSSQWTESATLRDTTLWEAVLEFIQGNQGANRKRILERPRGKLVPGAANRPGRVGIWRYQSSVNPFSGSAICMLSLKEKFNDIEMLPIDILIISLSK